MKRCILSLPTGVATLGNVLSRSVRPGRRPYFAVCAMLACIALIIFSSANFEVEGQGAGPTVVSQQLAVRSVVTGLTTPSTMAFLNTNDILVLEKNTGRVQSVTDGTVQSTVLDLAVNFASERGLLGISLHPHFANNGFV